MTAIILLSTAALLCAVLVKYRADRTDLVSKRLFWGEWADEFKRQNENLLDANEALSEDNNRLRDKLAHEKRSSAALRGWIKRYRAERENTNA